MKRFVGGLVGSLFLGWSLLAAGPDQGRIPTHYPASVLGVTLVAHPARVPNGPQEMLVRIQDCELDAFAIVSEPSNTLLGFVVDSDLEIQVVEGSAWFAENVAPFLFDPRGMMPSRMTTPLRDGTVVTFQHQARSERDDTLVFLAMGKALSSYEGSESVRFPLVQKQREGMPLHQSFRLVARSALRAVGGGGGNFLCGCGNAPPSPCPANGSDPCSICITCTDKPGAFCRCCFETTTLPACGPCGRNTATCGAQCPYC